MVAARYMDPDTSHEAADSVDNLSRRWQDVLMLLRKYGPMGDPSIQLAHEHELTRGTVIPQSPSGLRTRRSELVRSGLVVEHGDAINDQGRRFKVWAALGSETGEYAEIPQPRWAEIEELEEKLRRARREIRELRDNVRTTQAASDTVRRDRDSLVATVSAQQSQLMAIRDTALKWVNTRRRGAFVSARDVNQLMKDIARMGDGQKVHNRC